jgi:hypothetical protein
MEVFSVHSFDVWAQDVFKEFFGTIVFAAWEKIFHLDYQQRYFVWSPATFYIMTIIKLLNTIHVLTVFLQVSKSDPYK